MAGDDTFECPGCGTALAGGTGRCGDCGIRLVGELAARLWGLDQHIAVLFAQREQIVVALRRDDAANATRSSRPVAAVGTETKRLLLGLGAVCLVASLSAGTALIWPALGVGGQTAVLLFLTVALFAGAVGLQRRLPATAEAIAAVAVAACGVDVVAGRRLVAPDLAGATAHAYWIGTALAAVGVLCVAGSLARRLYSPAVGAVVASYGAVVAIVSPTSPDDVALVGLLGTVLGVALVYGADIAPMQRRGIRDSAALGALMSTAVGVAAALESAPGRAVGLACGLAMAVGMPVVAHAVERRVAPVHPVDPAAAAARVRRGAALAGGVVAAVLLLRAAVIPLGASSLVTAGAAAAVLLAGLAWTKRRPESPVLFVGAGAGLVEIAAQVTLQGRALTDADLGRGAIGLGIVAVISAVAAAVASRSEIVAVAAASSAAAAIGAVAEAVGIDGVTAASGASGAAAAGIFGIAVFALAVSPGRRLLLPSAAVAATSGIAAAVAIHVNLAVRGVTVPEAYVIVPGVATLLLGLLAMRRRSAGSSWVLLPAFFIGTMPTLSLALGGDGTRQVALLLAGGILIVLGAHLRLACPLWVGATELLLVVSRIVGPQIEQLPRWLTLGLLGAALLGLGATWERRVQDVRGMAERLRPEIAALR